MYKNWTIVLDKIEQLKHLDDRLEIFGAATHKYNINPTITEEQILIFEKQKKTTIPTELRFFYTNVGNGGVGPDHGLLPLEQLVIFDMGLIGIINQGAGYFTCFHENMNGFHELVDITTETTNKDINTLGINLFNLYYNWLEEEFGKMID